MSAVIRKRASALLIDFMVIGCEIKTPEQEYYYPGKRVSGFILVIEPHRGDHMIKKGVYGAPLVPVLRVNT